MNTNDPAIDRYYQVLASNLVQKSKSSHAWLNTIDQESALILINTKHPGFVFNGGIAIFRNNEGGITLHGGAKNLVEKTPREPFVTKPKDISGTSILLAVVLCIVVMLVLLATWGLARLGKIIDLLEYEDDEAGPVTTVI